MQEQYFRYHDTVFGQAAKDDDGKNHFCHQHADAANTIDEIAYAFAVGHIPA